MHWSEHRTSHLRLCMSCNRSVLLQGSGWSVGLSIIVEFMVDSRFKPLCLPALRSGEAWVLAKGITLSLLSCGCGKSRTGVAKVVGVIRDDTRNSFRNVKVHWLWTGPRTSLGISSRSVVLPCCRKVWTRSLNPSQVFRCVILRTRFASGNASLQWWQLCEGNWRLIHAVPSADDKSESDICFNSSAGSSFLSFWTCSAKLEHCLKWDSLRDKFDPLFNLSQYRQQWLGNWRPVQDFAGGIMGRMVNVINQEVFFVHERESAPSWPHSLAFFRLRASFPLFCKRRSSVRTKNI